MTTYKYIGYKTINSASNGSTLTIGIFGDDSNHTKEVLMNRTIIQTLQSNPTQEFRIIKNDKGYDDLVIAGLPQLPQTGLGDL